MNGALPFVDLRWQSTEASTRPGAIKVLHIATSGFGTLLPTEVYSAQQAKQLFGEGQIHVRVASWIYYRQEPVIVQRIDPADQGSIGAVEYRVSGSGAPAAIPLLTANPVLTQEVPVYDRMTIQIKVIRGGATGAARLAFSLDGGDTYGSSFIFSGTYTNSGFILSLASLTDEFVTGATYRWTVQPAAVTNEEIIAALNTAKSGPYPFDLVIIHPEVDEINLPGLGQELQIAADTAKSEGRFFLSLLPFRDRGVDSTATWRQELLDLDRPDQPSVGITFGMGVFREMWAAPAYSVRRPILPHLVLVGAKAAAGEGWHQPTLQPLPDCISIDPNEDTEGGALNGAHVSTVRTWPGRGADSFYVTQAWTNAEESARQSIPVELVRCAAEAAIMLAGQDLIVGKTFVANQSGAISEDTCKALAFAFRQRILITPGVKGAAVVLAAPNYATTQTFEGQYEITVGVPSVGIVLTGKFSVGVN